MAGHAEARSLGVAHRWTGEAPDRAWLTRAAVFATAFVVLTVLVGARALAGVDRALMEIAQRGSSDDLIFVAGLLNYLAAAEVTLASTALLALVLWRKGLPLWRAVAPLVFLVSIPIELTLKLTLNQPTPGDEFYRETMRYALLSVPSFQSYPSGHSIRSAFLALLIGYLATRAFGLHRAWPLWPCVALVMLVNGWTRAHLGHHWPMDVLGGWFLGGTLAYVAIALLAPVQRLTRR